MRASLLCQLLEAIRQGRDFDTIQALGQIVNEEKKKGNTEYAEQLMNAWNGKQVDYSVFERPVSFELSN